MAKYTMAVMTNAKPGRDDEFNAWYTDLHLGQVLAIPGFTSAQRFKVAGEPGEHGPKYRYYAVYEMETDDPAAVVADMMSRHGTPQLESCDAMDPDAYFGLYESITPVVTK